MIIFVFGPFWITPTIPPTLEEELTLALFLVLLITILLLWYIPPTIPPHTDFCVELIFPLNELFIKNILSPLTSPTIPPAEVSVSIVPLTDKFCIIAFVYMDEKSPNFC